MSITHHSSLEEIAAIVSEALTAKGLEAVLSGGAVVTIYSKNEYQSNDLDFVSPESIKELEEVMRSLGFQKEGRHFTHPNTKFFVEFPAAPLAVGNQPVKKWDQLKTAHGTIQILTPTDSVMDRLAGYFAWKDKQNLDQAVMIALRHPIKFSKIKAWAKTENEIEKYEKFLSEIKKRSPKP